MYQPTQYDLCKSNGLRVRFGSLGAAVMAAQAKTDYERCTVFTVESFRPESKPRTVYICEQSASGELTEIYE